MKHIRQLAGAAAIAAIALVHPAAAADKLKMTVGQRGNWDTAVLHLGEKAGIFKKHDLELQIIYTSGSGETLQPVISGGVDMGFAVGTLGAMAAYAKRAPVRIIGAQATGAADYWYAKNPAIKTLKDTDGKTIAFSSNGSSTQSIVRAFITEFKLTAKPQATGNPAATLTAVMTDQVDVGPCHVCGDEQSACGARQGEPRPFQDVRPPADGGASMPWIAAFDHLLWIPDRAGEPLTKVKSDKVS